MLAEARRSFTTLSLFGYRVDGVVANRVFPDAEGDAWRAGWVAAQAEVLERGRAVVRRAADLALGLPRGGAGRRRRAARRWPTRCTTAPTRWLPPAGAGPLKVTRNAAGAVLRLELPFVTRGEVDLARHGDELVVTVGSYRRLLSLPPGWPGARSRARASRTGRCRSGSRRGRHERRHRTGERHRAPRRGRLGRGGGGQAAGRALRLGPRPTAATSVTACAAVASAALHDVDEHLATGAPECRYCPVCRAVHVVRDAAPRSHPPDAWRRRT